MDRLIGFITGGVVMFVIMARVAWYYKSLADYYLDKNITATQTVLGLCRHIRLKYGDDVINNVKEHLERKNES